MQKIPWSNYENRSTYDSSSFISLPKVVLHLEKIHSTIKNPKYHKTS